MYKFFKAPKHNKYYEIKYPNKKKKIKNLFNLFKNLYNKKKN